jgi:hypothetical protein
MSAENWRELLDDDEVRRIVEMVTSTTRSPDRFLADDLPSYLWDRSVDIAIAYAPDIQAEEPTRYWYAYLWKALNAAARQHAHATYARGYGGDEARQRIAEHRDTLSVDELVETGGDLAFTTHQTTRGEYVPQSAGDQQVYDIGDHNDLHEPRWPDAPGRYRVSPDDPLHTILLIERYEAASRHLRAKTRAEGITYQSMTGLCADPGCWNQAYQQGLCSKHYQRHRDRWGTENATPCKIATCTRPATARELCGAHYAAWRRQDPNAPRCLDCDRAAVNHGRCTYHAKIAREAAA